MQGNNLSAYLSQTDTKSIHIQEKRNRIKQHKVKAH